LHAEQNVEETRSKLTEVLSFWSHTGDA
jgi:hypothetical protein